MERILTVSYGYVKFTFGAMIFSAIIFSLAGLAIKSPRVWLLLVVLGVAVFFFLKSEWETRRRRSDARKTKDSLHSPTEEIPHWAATFAQAALLISSAVAPRPVAKTTVVVSEWRYKHGRSAVPEANGASPERQDDAEISLARKALEGRLDDLDRAGFTLAFISKDRTGNYLAAFQNVFKLVHPFPSVSYIPGGSNIVIGFMLLRREFVLNPEIEIAEILKDSFDLVKDRAPNPVRLPAESTKS